MVKYPILMCLFLLFFTSNGFANAIPPKTQEKIDLCFKKNDAQSCYWAANALDADSGTSNKDLENRLFKHGCDLGSLSNCHGFASRLMNMNDDTQKSEGLSLYQKNCQKGYWFSCESLGYYLLKRGNDEEAREAYSKVCSKDSTFRGCRELGNLSKSAAQKNNLKSQCEKGQDWACMALGFTELKDKQIKPAKVIFMDQCKKGKSFSVLFCEEAAKLITLPPDAKEYVEKQQNCFHWGGEEPYDKDRAQQISRGIKRDCVDRTTEFNALKQKYNESPDILFVLEHNKTSE